MIRQIWGISSLDLRLLLRKKTHLAVCIAVPILGAGIFRMLGGYSSCSVSVVGLFCSLGLSAVFLATGWSLSSVLFELLSSDFSPGRATVFLSWSVSAGVVLLLQSVLYDMAVMLVSPSAVPGILRTASGIVFALLLGIIAIGISLHPQKEK